MCKLALLSVLALSVLPASAQLVSAPPMTKAYGVYCLPAGETPGQTVVLTGSAMKSLWSAPYISGMALRETWSVNQTANNSTYDWSFFDSGLAQAQLYNKKISLAVAAGAFCPTWLITAGAQYISITVQTSFQQSAQTLKMVLPWDPIFQSKWSNLVTAMGARYDADPNVAYVYIGGTGTYIESFMVQNQTDYNTFAAAGGLPSWIQGVEAVIDMYGHSFKKTPFVLAVGNPCAQLASEQAAGQQAVQQVIAYGFSKYPLQFGVVNQGLDQDSDNTAKYEGPGYFLNSTITSNAAAAPVGFQTLTAATGNKSKYSVGDLSTALTAGVNLGGHFIEVYRADCANTAYTSLLQSVNTQLISNIQYDFQSTYDFQGAQP